MKKQTIILLIVLLMPVMSWAACTDNGGGVWTTAGNESADVADCVTAASAGDTINVVAGDGSASWDSGDITLTNEKPLNIVGPGANELTIIINTTSPIIITDSASTISCFKFESPEDTNREAITARGQGWRVHHCTYHNILSAQTNATSFVNVNDLIGDYGYPEGLVDNNIIINGKVVVSGGSNWGEEKLIWSADANLGGSNNVYIEDNIFTSDIAAATLCVDANYSGGYVFRYNTVSDGYVLAHGLQLYETRATRKWETYGNLFQSTSTATLDMINVKGGEGVAFYNLEDSIEPYNLMIYTYHERDSDFDNVGIWNGCDGESIADGNETGEDGWLCRDQIGAGKDASVWDDPAETSTAQANSPAYFWVNKDDAGTWPAVYNPDATHIQENRDFYTYDGSFDGSDGIGCGTLGNRPATCTVGTAYWATDQSCSDLTNYVGASPTTPISGTLYKCTSTDTWEVYYTPYTYPHPLREENYGPSKLGIGDKGISYGNGG